MTALSRTLEADGHSAELPYGTPPSRDSRSGLAGVHDSPLRGGKSKPASRRTTPSKNSIKDWSDEDMSSSGGDRLPDETNSAKESLNAANDMDFLLQVTKWLADRRDVDPTEIFPEVAELLLGKEDGKTLPDTPQSIRVRQEKPLPSLPGSVEEGEIKSTLRPFVPKRRLTEGELLANHSTTAMPRAIEKISPTDVRRFSFMPGDDTAPTALTHWSVEDRVTKRRPDLKAIHSRSLADISSAFHPLLQNAISPRSPKSRPSSVDTATATTTQSKIPSPTTEYSTGSPRRDDSGSNRSVVTVIRDSSGRSINTSNPNSPSSVTGSDSFVDPIKRLRSDPAAVAASRAAADSRGSTMKTTKDGKAGPSRKSSATGSENRTTSTKAQIDHGCAGGESRAENVRRGNAISPDFETKAAKGITSGGLRT